MSMKFRNIPQLYSDFRVHILLLVFISGVVLFYGLGNQSLKALDEAKWAEISSEMIISGDYLTPRISGRIFSHKPPLRMWLNTFSFHIFGENEFALRLWSSLSSIGIILLTYIIS